MRFEYLDYCFFCSSFICSKMFRFFSWSIWVYGLPSSLSSPIRKLPYLDLFILNKYLTFTNSINLLNFYENNHDTSSDHLNQGNVPKCSDMVPLFANFRDFVSKCNNWRNDFLDILSDDFKTKWKTKIGCNTVQKLNKLFDRRVRLSNACFIFYLFLKC